MPREPTPGEPTPGEPTTWEPTPGEPTTWETRLGKDQSEDLEEVAMSMTESSSKIHKPTLYDEAVNNPIHGRCWREAIENELQNLENHQTWEYD